jgi:hypothetical protein
VEGYGFPYIVGEFIEGVCLSHNWQIQALGYVLFLAPKDTDLNNAFQKFAPFNSKG